MTYDPRNPPLMECGHTANSTHNRPDGTSEPACVICAGLDAGAYIVSLKPSLEGRIAKCTHGDREVPSSWGLAFFQYRGEGTYAASICTCGYAPAAHTQEAMAKNWRLKCLNYTPRGAVKTDSYYCGCFGWD